MHLKFEKKKIMFPEWIMGQIFLSGDFNGTSILFFFVLMGRADHTHTVTTQFEINNLWLWDIKCAAPSVINGQNDKRRSLSRLGALYDTVVVDLCLKLAIYSYGYFIFRHIFKLEDSILKLWFIFYEFCWSFYFFFC